MTCKSVRIRRRRRGFTLLEVLMVIVIIGILAAFIVPSLMGTQTGAQIDMARNTIKSGLTTPLELFRTHVGRYPTTDEGLVALINKPGDAELAQNWRGPYIKDANQLKDPWGTEFIYVSPGRYNEDSFDLSSAGPDRRPGTDDDITNWKKS